MLRLTRRGDSSRRRCRPRDRRSLREALLHLRQSPIELLRNVRLERLLTEPNLIEQLNQPRRELADPRRGQPVDALLQRSNGTWRMRQIACTEVGCAPAAQQYSQAYPNLPRALLF